MSASKLTVTVVSAIRHLQLGAILAQAGTQVLCRLGLAAQMSRRSVGDSPQEMPRGSGAVPGGGR